MFNGGMADLPAGQDTRAGRGRARQQGRQQLAHGSRVSDFEVGRSGNRRLRSGNDPDNETGPRRPVSPLPYGRECGQVTDVVADVEQGPGGVVDETPQRACLVDAWRADLEHLRTRTDFHAVVLRQRSHGLAQDRQDLVGVASEPGVHDQGESFVLDPHVRVVNQQRDELRQLGPQGRHVLRSRRGLQVAAVPALGAVHALDDDSRDLGEPANVHGGGRGPTRDDGHLGSRSPRDGRAGRQPLGSGSSPRDGG